MLKTVIYKGKIPSAAQLAAHLLTPGKKYTVLHETEDLYKIATDNRSVEWYFPKSDFIDEVSNNQLVKGQRVFDHQYGFGTVITILTGRVRYPVEVHFDQGIYRRYTLDGRHNETDNSQGIYLAVGSPLGLAGNTFSPGEKVYVEYVNGAMEIRGVFTIKTDSETLVELHELNFALKKSKIITLLSKRNNRLVSEPI